MSKNRVIVNRLLEKVYYFGFLAELRYKLYREIVQGVMAELRNDTILTLPYMLFNPISMLYK